MESEVVRRCGLPPCDLTQVGKRSAGHNRKVHLERPATKLRTHPVIERWNRTTKGTTTSESQLHNERKGVQLDFNNSILDSSILKGPRRWRTGTRRIRFRQLVFKQLDSKGCTTKGKSYSSIPSSSISDSSISKARFQRLDFKRCDRKHA